MKRKNPTEIKTSPRPSSASLLFSLGRRSAARGLALAPGAARAAPGAATLAPSAAVPSDGRLLRARALLAAALLAAGGAAALAVGNFLGTASAFGGASAVGHGCRCCSQVGGARGS